MNKLKNQYFIIIISLAFTLTNFLLFKWYEDLSLYPAVRICITTFLLNYLFWTIFSFNSYLFKFVLILFSVTSIIFVYSCYIYNISPLVNTASLFLQTDLNEIQELLTVSEIIPLLIITIVLVFVVKSTFQAKWHYALLAFLVSVASIILVNKSDQKTGLIGSHEITLERLATRLPINLFIDWMFELKKVIYTTKTTDLSKLAAFSMDKEPNDLLIIFIVGESAI